MKPHIRKQFFLGIVTLFSIYCFYFVNTTHQEGVTLVKIDSNSERIEVAKDNENDMNKVDKANLPDVEAVKKVITIMKRLLSVS